MDITDQEFYNEEYFLGTSGMRGNFSLLELDTKFIDRTQTVIDYFKLTNIAEGTIAEVGCGTAPFYRLIKAKPELKQLRVVCSDVTEGGVNLLDEADKPPFELAGAEELPYKSGSMLGIVEWDVLEHIPHPERAIAEAARVLQPGGFFHIVCPNPESWLRAEADPNKDPYRRDKSHIFPPIVTYRYLENTMRKAGFEVEIFTRGFEGQDGKNQTGLASMVAANKNATGTHLVAFAVKQEA